MRKLHLTLALAAFACAGGARAQAPKPVVPSVAPVRTTPLEAHGLNPQPEPPGRPVAAAKLKPAHVTSAEAKGLNPQPEPPGSQACQGKAAGAAATGAALTACQ